jgi:anti-repressor protein
MNEIQIFKNSEFGEIRTTTKDGEPWFVAADVCEHFGMTNRNRIMQSLDDDEKGGTQMTTPGGMQTITIISEAGLYNLLFALQPSKARGVSDEYIEKRCAELKAFKRWITHDVIPTIRNTGGYVSNEQAFVDTYLPFADEGTKAMFSQTLSALRQANAKIAQDKPKVLFSDAVSASSSSIHVGDLAKILKQNGVEVGQKRLFSWLRENGYLIKSGASKNMPTQRAMEMGLFEIKETIISHADGHTAIIRTSKATGRGCVYFVNKLCDGGNMHARLSR